VGIERKDDGNPAGFSGFPNHSPEDFTMAEVNAVKIADGQHGVPAGKVQMA
jgi:hypothetical protein